MPTNIIDKELEKFDKRFNKTLWTVTDVKESDLGEYKTWLESTRDFLHTSLTTVREEMIKEVIAKAKGMEKELNHGDGGEISYFTHTMCRGYNKCIEDILSLLQCKISKE